MKRIKTSDNVVVISGRDKGKTGIVLEVSEKKEAVKIKNIMMVVKHQKPRGMGGAAGGIKQKEAWIAQSKVMPLCSHCNKASRVQKKSLDSGVSSRMCSRCKEVFKFFGE